MKKIKISLMFKIVVLCVTLILVSSLTFRHFASLTAKDTIEKTVGEMALTIIRSVATTIDGDQHQELDTAEEMESEYYQELRTGLYQIKKETGLKYLYTLARTTDGVYYYVVDGAEEGNEEASLLGDVESDVSEMMLRSFEGIEGYEFDENEVYGTLISGYVPIKNSSGEIVAMMGADFDAEYMTKMLSLAEHNMLKMLIIILVVGILVSVSFSYLIVRSIKHLKSKVELAQSGNLTVHIDIKQADEVGSLAAAFQKMIDNMSSMIRNIRNHSEEAIQNVKALNDSIDVSNKATEEITKIVSDIAGGTIKQVEGVSDMEESMKRVFSQIEVITKKVNSVNKASDVSLNEMQVASEKLINSVRQINLVNDTVENTAGMMKNLEDKFKEVLSFSSSVTALATKTNLLALNASIEAASAGEHGRGFAVVAGEIKNLAKQSSDASKRINELIEAVQEEINNSSTAIEDGITQAKNGVSVMSEVEQNLDIVSQSNSKINRRIKEIEAAIIQIEGEGRNVLDKTILLAEISRNLSSGSQQAAAETEEQYAIAEGIRNDLQQFRNNMEELGSTVNQFQIS